MVEAVGDVVENGRAARLPSQDAPNLYGRGHRGLVRARRNPVQWAVKPFLR